MNALRKVLANIKTVPPTLTDMTSWKDRKGRAALRSFTAEDGKVWLEQNATKNSRWAKFAREGHEVAWEFKEGGGYSGRMLVDGEILTPAEATRKFLRGRPMTTDRRNDGPMFLRKELGR